MRWVSILLFGLTLSPAAAYGAGWTQPEGAFYAKVWNRTLVGRRVFITERTTARLPDSYQDHQINVYAEYGLIDDLTLTLNSTALGYAKVGDRDRAYFGGAAIGGRYRLTNGALSSAVEVQVGLRPSSGNLASGTVTVNRGGADVMQAYDAEPAIGTAHGSLEVQGGFALPFLWLSSAAGIRAFTNGRLDPAVYISTQMGWISSFGLILDLHLNWYHSTGAIEPINIFGAGQTRYLGYGLGASFWFTDHIGVHFGIDSVLFATANAATPSLSVGMEFK